MTTDERDNGRSDLGALFDRLDPLERDALILIYRDRLTHKQIADKFGTPRAAVTEIVAHAMRRLADLVENLDNAPPGTPS